MILKHAFIPLDNTRLAHLCGMLDEHLHQIEAALDVSISRRSESFRISGAKARAERALRLMQNLYERARKPIAPESFQLALAEAGGDVAPLAFMRERTLNHAFVILDEAQNTTPEQMKMFLTRIGFGSKCVVTGDTSQADLPKGMLSGLVDAERVLHRVKGIAMTHFTSADVVRHPLVARIVMAYEAQTKAREQAS